MERIRDISKAKPGDFLNYHGSLTLVSAIEYDQDAYKITLENGITVREKTNSRMEFFRTLTRIKGG